MIIAIVSDKTRKRFSEYSNRIPEQDHTICTREMFFRKGEHGMFMHFVKTQTKSMKEQDAMEFELPIMDS